MTTAPLRRIREATAAEAWVCDGNYSAVRSIVLERADTVVWLDLPLRTNLWRVVRRTWRRARSREELWAGNRESWGKQLGRDSLVWWVLSTHRRRRRQYEERFAGQDPSVLRVLRFRSSPEAEAWLAGL